jgi:hypothetical protein
MIHATLMPIDSGFSLPGDILFGLSIVESRGSLIDRKHEDLRDIDMWRAGCGPQDFLSNVICDHCSSKTVNTWVG